MTITQQDREWVQSMIAEATTKSLAAAGEYTWQAIAKHEVTCPNATRLRTFIFGLLIGLGLLTSGQGIRAFFNSRFEEKQNVGNVMDIGEQSNWSDNRGELGGVGSGEAS